MIRSASSATTTADDGRLLGPTAADGRLLGPTAAGMSIPRGTEGKMERLWLVRMLTAA